MTKGEFAGRPLGPSLRLVEGVVVHDVSPAHMAGEITHGFAAQAGRIRSIAETHKILIKIDKVGIGDRTVGIMTGRAWCMLVHDMLLMLLEALVPKDTLPGMATVA